MILEPATVVNMTTTASLTDQTPVEIDTLLYPLLAERYVQSEKRGDIRRALAKTIWPAEYKATYERYLRFGDHRQWSYGNNPWEQADIRRAGEKLQQAEAEIERLNTEIVPLEAEYASRPWSRFVIVPDGHIHTSFAGCGSLRPTTQRLLLIDASGSDADEVVRTYNFVACTKCFPNAPVAPAKVDPSYCTAGPYDYTKRSPSARYATCKECGYNGAVSSLGKLRKHKREV